MGTAHATLLHPAVATTGPRHATGRVPSTMDELGAVQEITTFDYTTPSGESRVRLVIPARKCFSACDSSPVTPDNPWFVLAYGSCGPPGATCGFAPPNLATFLPGGAPATYTFTTPPYMLNGDPLLKRPNPNNPSPVPYHSNVMRHWSGMTQDNPVQVIISCPVSSAAAGTDIFFTRPLPAPSVYPWSTWTNHIQTTFAKFANVPTAEVWVTTSVVYADTPVLGTTTTPGYSSATAYAVYDPPGLAGVLPPAPAPLASPASGQLIWDYSAAAIPPNALWTNTGTEPNRTGPTGNGFNEVLFLQNRAVNNGGFCSMDLNAQTGAIIECDVVFDVNSFITGNLIGLPNQTTAFVHEIGHFFGLDHTNLHPGLAPGAPPISTSYPGFPSWMPYTGAPTEYPGMVGGVTRFIGTNMVSTITALHPDDAVGLSRIYPVQIPVPPKDPLINTTATIRGRLQNPLTGQGRFGDSVFPLLRSLLLPTPTAPPDVTASFPRIGTISGTARFADWDVVGGIDTSTNSLCTGAFEIIGVPTPQVVSNGWQYDIVAEDLGFSGAPGGAGYGEWYSDLFLNPTGNPIVTTAPPVVYQTRFCSNDAALPGLTSAWLNGIPVVGSFSVVAGTIIEMGVIAHKGGANPLAYDATSRPLLSIVERVRPTTGNITLTSLSNYPVNLSGMNLTVNGVNFSLTQATIPPPVYTPPIVTLTIPVTLLNAVAPPGVPARLRFTATETGPAPTGITFVRGINEVQYL